MTSDSSQVLRGTLHLSPRRQVLRLPDVLALTGFSRAQVYKLIAAGEFPRPVQLSRRCVGWRAEEVDRFIESRPMTARTPKEAQTQSAPDA